MALTQEGRIFYERAGAAIGALEDVEAQLQPGADGLRGCVRIALPGALAGASFLERLRALLGLHPELRIQFRVTNAPVNLVAEGLDIAVVVGQPADSTLTGRLLGRVSWVLAASPGYLSRAGRPHVPADLAAHRCLLLLGNQPQREWILVDPQGREVSVPVNGMLEADDSRTLGEAVYAGLGIGVRPISECAHGRDNPLERVLHEYRFQPLDVYALLPPGRIQGGRVAACLEVLRSAVADLT